MFRALCLPVALMTLSIGGGLACNTQYSGYRNFWLELSATTACGTEGGPPAGVCALAATCAVMGGEAVGRHNCPLTRSTCCRPVARCDATSIALNLLWESPDYQLASRLHTSTCELTVVPSSDTCYIRIDFDDMDIESTKVDACELSSLTIKSQAQGDGKPICGTLNHKTTFVKVGTSRVGLPVPVTLALNMSHLPHKYSARINHVKCSDVKRFDRRRYRTIDSGEVFTPLERSGRVRDAQPHKEPAYMARLFAVAYTDAPLIRSCPVTFITKDIVIGAASCSLRLGGPGTSKGLMVVHGASHLGPSSSLPTTVSQMAKYVAANGVVVKATSFHPMYDHDTHQHDLAVYFLNKTVYTAEPVELPALNGEFVDLPVFISRYEHHRKSEDLTVLANAHDQPSRVLANAECEGSGLPGVSAVTSKDTLCLSGGVRDHSPCEGEVGSPVVHVGSSNTVTLLGLMMGGYQDCTLARSISEPEPALKIINYIDFIDVATSPSYKIPPTEVTVSPFTPVVEWFNSLWPTPEGEVASAREFGDE